MAQKRKPDQTKLIIDMALKLAEGKGWAQLSLPLIARAAKISEADVRRHFPDKWAILVAVMQRLEKDAADSVADYMGDNWRDNLMEILMARFDVAEEHRRALSSVPAAWRRDPSALRKLARPFYATMRRIADMAGMPDNPLAVPAFCILYVSVVDVWLKDESRDKAKTMAAIDQRTATLERALAALSCK
jgi:AcrR family transcriptional regulator